MRGLASEEGDIAGKEDAGALQQCEENMEAKPSFLHHYAVISQQPQ